MFKSLNYLSVFSIAHRDIKPHNILINIKNHKLAICDFGSSKQLIPSIDLLIEIKAI
jgi:serine/threonine protein kinase